jgi:DNA topoisomerase-1
MTRIEKLQMNGIRRLGSPRKGFRYVTANGRPPGPHDLQRIRSLVLPPAWKDVAIAASPGSALQAVGRDAAGRWQYRYSDAHVRRREQEKSRRLLHFLDALPKMRAAVRRDLALPGLPREKVLACILRILSMSFLRPGSQVYASENGSYGIATLRNRHVTVKGGDLVEYDFPGKSGKRQHAETRDPAVASIIRKLRKLLGSKVFKYFDAEGRITDVKRRHVNQYIKEVMGERFSAKDFRTWAGTLLCANMLARAGSDPSDSSTARKRKVVAAVRETAEILGNTPSVCRASYIDSSVLDSFERGKTIERRVETVEQLVTSRGRLRVSEKALRKLLRQRAA